MTTQRYRPAPRRPAFQFLAFALAVGPALAADAPAAPAATAPPAPVADQATQNSQKWPLATSKALILAMTNSSDRAIAVGERGIVLTSASRQDWQQVDNVPTRSTLTAVTSVGNQVWAVGHDGTIIHSADGGGTWTRQRSAPYVPGSDDPHNGTPLMGVLFSDEKHGYAVGAYAQLLRTDDGGENWTSVDVVKHEGGDAAAAKSGGSDNWTFKQEDLQVSDEADPHINGIAKLDNDTFLMVGERGTAFRSVDGGQNWRRLKLPYKGSMFGVLAYDSRHALAYGLRGHVLETRDQGDSWTEVVTGTELSLMGGAAVGDGGAVLVGANGVVLMRNSSNEKFALTTNADGGVLAAVLPLANAANAELVVSGENGIGRYSSTTPEGKP